MQWYHVTLGLNGVQDDIKCINRGTAELRVENEHIKGCSLYDTPACIP